MSGFTEAMPGTQPPFTETGDRCPRWVLLALPISLSGCARIVDAGATAGPPLTALSNFAVWKLVIGLGAFNPVAWLGVILYQWLMSK